MAEISELGDGGRPAAEAADPWTSENSIPIRQTSSLASDHYIGSRALGQELSDRVDPDLLRGVQIHKVMRCMGAIFSESPTLGETNLLHLSQLVTKLDDFISHDWSTGRWTKFLALCVVYNARDAVVGSLSLCLALFTLMSFGVLARPAPVCYCGESAGGQDVDSPEALFFFPVGLASFWLLLLFGQRLRGITGCCRRTAFVDKVCIDQHDPDSKQRGILMLAGFLARSDRLVLLWSPRYLTRLWCVYEVATWLKIHGNLHTGVKFMPVNWAAMLCVLQAMIAAVFALMKISCAFKAVPVVLAALPGLLACWMWGAHCLRQVAQDLRSLPVQIKTFSIRHAECFCCANNHVDPVSGADMACDRELVQSALFRWFGGSRSVDAVLDSFDAKVRTDVRRGMVARFGGIGLSYMDSLFFAHPAVLYGMEAILFRPRLPLELSVRRIFYYVCMAFFMCPCLIKLWVYAVITSLRKGPAWRWLLDGWAGIVLLALSGVALAGAMWLPLRVALEVAHPLPFWCLACAWCVVTLLLYSGRLLESTDLKAESVSKGIARARSGPLGEGSMSLGPGDMETMESSSISDIYSPSDQQRSDLSVDLQAAVFGCAEVADTSEELSADAYVPTTAAATLFPHEELSADAYVPTTAAATLFPHEGPVHAATSGRVEEAEISEEIHQVPLSVGRIHITRL